MAEILIKKYKNCNKFCMNIPFYNNSIAISEKDIFRYAALVGDFSSHNITINGELFYYSMINMALLEKNGYYTIGSDYKNAEQSIRNSISFFMGMFAAEIVAEKIYKIPNLYHLTDQVITFTSTGKHPDFFGINNKNRGILIEAKGTVATRPTNSTVSGAKKQLRAIKSVVVEVNGGKQSFNYNDMKRYVVASSFDLNDRLTYHCIDPEPEGEQEIGIDLDKATALYYQNIMNIILHRPYRNYGTYIISDTWPYKIGLDREIYNRLSEYEKLYTGINRDIVDKFSYNGVYNFVSERISRIEIPNSNVEVSTGLNGVICL